MCFSGPSLWCVQNSAKIPKSLPRQTSFHSRLFLCGANFRLHHQSPRALLNVNYILHTMSLFVHFPDVLRMPGIRFCLARLPRVNTPGSRPGSDPQPGCTRSSRRDRNLCIPRERQRPRPAARRMYRNLHRLCEDEAPRTITEACHSDSKRAPGRGAARCWFPRAAVRGSRADRRTATVTAYRWCCRSDAELIHTISLSSIVVVRATRHPALMPVALPPTATSTGARAGTPTNTPEFRPLCCCYVRA